MSTPNTELAKKKKLKRKKPPNKMFTPKKYLIK